MTSSLNEFDFLEEINDPHDHLDDGNLAEKIEDAAAQQNFDEIEASVNAASEAAHAASTQASYKGYIAF